MRLISKCKHLLLVRLIYSLIAVLAVFSFKPANTVESLEFVVAQFSRNSWGPPIHALTTLTK